MNAPKISYAEFLDWLDVMTPEQLKKVIEIGERVLAERRLKDSLETPPQA